MLFCEVFCKLENLQFCFRITLFISWGLFYWLFVVLFAAFTGFMYTFMSSFHFRLFFINLFKFSLLIDFISIVFVLILFVVVFSVFCFAYFYMRSDIFVKRFFYILNSFVFSMILLIFISDFLFLLIGWDGLGFTSFLLICYYYSRISWSSSFKTFLINRLGDGFLISFVVLVVLFLFIKRQSFFYTKEILLLLFILGVFTKRAQYPFSSWLPAAMAAPTPVSALVHSSTLVTAGLYLYFRFFYIIPRVFCSFVCYVGIFTLLLARVSACFEWDIKKVVAFRTLSQLGLLFCTFSLGLYYVGFFHLLTHACFKSLIFTCCGYFMLVNFHFQDLRSLGSSFEGSFVFFCVLLSSSLSLCGVSFLSGYFSKDLIILRCYRSFNILFYSVLILSVRLTVIYSFRLIFISTSSFKISYQAPVYFSVLWVLVLTILSISFGFLVSNWFMGLHVPLNRVCIILTLLIVISIIISSYCFLLLKYRFPSSYVGYFNLMFKLEFMKRSLFSATSIFNSCIIFIDSIPLGVYKSLTININPFHSLRISTLLFCLGGVVLFFI